MTDRTWIKLMKCGEQLGCHQMPERSLFYKNYQFPVCARCTGVLLSVIPAIIVFIAKKIPIKICIAMSGVMFTDWFIQRTGIKESTNNRRLITGFIGGFGFTTLHLYFYRYIWREIKNFF